MKRREVFLGGAAFALGAGRAALAQPAKPLIGMLLHGSPAPNGARLDAWFDGMRTLGYVEGRDFRFEVRWSHNRADALPALAHELVGLRPAAVVAGPVIAAQAVQRESKTVPIVMASGAGARQAGLIASLGRPGGNVTGTTNQGDDLTEKLFETINAMVPKAKRIGMLNSGKALVHAEVWDGARNAARAFGMTLVDLRAATAAEVRQLAALAKRERCEALVVALDPFLLNVRPEILALVAALHLPCAYFTQEFVEEGGLVSYSTDARDLYRRAAHYVVRILKGAKPADLPVEQPTKFELVINLKTAKALGITVPQAMLLRAERLIE